jgi:hypothetical protein
VLGTDTEEELFAEGRACGASPMSSGAFSGSACDSITTSLGDYEIELVEIRVRDGELDDVIP